VNALSPSSFDGFLNGRKIISGKGSGKLVLVYYFFTFSLTYMIAYLY
jgi:hypothetical protein